MSPARFSGRLPGAPSSGNAISRALFARRSHGLPLFDLTESNPTRVGLPFDGAEVLSALGDPRGLRYEPDPRGLPEARAAIAAYYAESRGAQARN